ncbi:TIGR01777 family oxidoreductase [Pseudoalteromonas sp. MMG013]|uniref:TIGR01777 family oxidoreductase n=1 Tax=Pseudoalteromonas sp. MMG013 TaxID=2822687 RepID=UPI001B388FAA|nr:TIGR01777 family oxidoreductase [Pseudoalteromonas sp. MMG013]MBQ4864715.1 TIGR01777 family oxidoreductase [Pseudoalteromonas sp. MMG013]
MRILVTGATGLIGRQLCGFLAQQFKVTALTRNVDNAQALFGRKVTCISTLETINFDTVDVVVNLAGEPIAEKRWSTKQKHLITESRINITQQLVTKITQATTPPHTFISGSAIGFYGRQNSHITIDETFNDYNPEFSHHLCNEWEQTARRAESRNTRVCVLRTGIVLSQDAGALTKMLPAFKLCLGGKMADGQQMMSWIHIDDIVNIILHLINNQHLSGTFNATAPNPVSNQEFTKILASTLSRPAVLPMPKIVLRLLFGEMADLLIYGQTVIPKKLLDSQFSFRFNHLDKALANLLR